LIPVSLRNPSSDSSFICSNFIISLLKPRILTNSLGYARGLIDISEDGTVYVDDEDIDIIGVFSFKESDPFIKEGDRLYKAAGTDFLLENYTVISGGLRQSNVNPTLAMAKMVEMQRSVGITNNIISDISELDKTVITRLGK